MKLYWQTLFLFSLASCSDNQADGPDGGPVAPPEREVTKIVCPVHQVPVFKVQASPAITCNIRDPKLGLTIEQIKTRFPYAIWDSSLHQVDDSKDAKFPRYCLICDRCQDSWGEYAATNPLPPEQRLEISISESQEILINDVEFDLEQVSAIAKLVASHQAKPKLILRISNNTPTKTIKSVVNACAEGGITEVTFGSYVAKTKSTPQPTANETGQLFLRSGVKPPHSD